LLSLGSRFHSSSYPHWAGAFQRTQRSNPALLRDFRVTTGVWLWEPSAPPSRLLCPVCLDPFALCRPLSDALGGRYSTDYYGSAVPVRALATCPPILKEALAGSGVARIAIYSSALGTFPTSLYLTSQVGKPILVDEWSLRLF
jgi:hypothetical protein